ncbi:MAG: PQQ-like beta-propeller repeat protein [Planctomycetes bacterium]|nr:PQQ-like beta-propeller repeat protein [Planctomycetota bacterium]
MRSLRRASADALLVFVALTALLWATISGAADRPKSERALSARVVGTGTPASAEAAMEGLIASSEPDWPQWRGPRRDGISDEIGLLRQWPSDGPPLAWKVAGIGRGWSSPIVVGDRVFVTGDVEDELVLFAYDRQGKLVWRTTNGRAWKGSFPGARACCAYSDGRIYHMNAHGRVICLEAATGRELWSTNILDRFSGREIRWGLSECLLVDGTRLIVTPGGRRALMAALDKQTGRTVWTTPPLGSDFVTHSSPILFRWSGRRILAQCSSAHGFGVDADTGQLLWAVPLKNRFGTNVSTPIYGDGCVYYVTPYAELGRLYRLRRRGREIAAEHVWTSTLDTVTGCGVLVDGTLFAAGYRRPKWWFAVDWQTGQTKSELKELTTGAAIYADGRLYCLDERGKVGLLQLDGDGMRLVSSFRLVSRRVHDAWTHPVLANGRLYLRYHETLWCFDVRSKENRSR